MNELGDSELSKRERQMMDICYASGSASAREIWDVIPDQPSYATVRKLLMILVEKGHLRRRREGKKYVYKPTASRIAAAKKAVNRVVQTFFNGSVEEAMMSILSQNQTKLSADELRRIAELIETARKEKTT